MIRPKLDETKGKGFGEDDELPDGVADVYEIFAEFMPAVKEDKKKDKKEKKEDKKDKKDDKKKDKKEDKADKKADKKKKPAKDAVKLKSAELVQVKNLIKSMIFGEGDKSKKGNSVTGWINWVSEKDVPPIIPWEFQIAAVLYK